MPGLKPECIETASESEQERYCCICEEEESRCSIALSDRGDTILFADGEEVVDEGTRCDCIMILRRDNMFEVYAIELKGIHSTDLRVQEEALNPDTLRQKWENCLKWALEIVEKFNSVIKKNFSITSYVVLVTTIEGVARISRSYTLIKHRKPPIKPILPNAGRIEGRVILCNNSITGRAVKTF
jgi:hypothetical protein